MSQVTNVSFLALLAVVLWDQQTCAGSRRLHWGGMAGMRASAHTSEVLPCKACPTTGTRQRSLGVSPDDCKGKGKNQTERNRIWTGAAKETLCAKACEM